MRSGITLSGANATFAEWASGKVNSAEDDGVLLAAELRDYDFSNVELIVFSACSTAEGKPLEQASVLSLQSAILETGVSNAVTTLWRVDDEIAPKIMRQLYTELINGASPPLALWKTRRSYFADRIQDGSLWQAVRDTAPFICVSQKVYP